MIDFDVDDEEIAQEPCPARRCCNCYYWTGNPGNMPTDFVCAVNIPRPLPAELDRVDDRKAYAFHNCPDFVANLEGQT